MQGRGVNRNQPVRDTRDPHYRDQHGAPRDPRDRRDMRDNRDRYDDRGYGRSGSGSRPDHARIFVALFSYDPQTMSPNPDACEEELAFREGQLIRVYGDKDADGFYWGEAGGRSGYVPCNIVSEVQVR